MAEKMTEDKAFESEDEAKAYAKEHSISEDTIQHVGVVFVVPVPTVEGKSERVDEPKPATTTQPK